MSEQITIADLLREAREIKYTKDATARFCFGEFYPTGVCSYRGYYDNLALNYSNDHSKRMEVKNLIKIVESSVGSKFIGYKGGEFEMGLHTKLWCANYGEAPNVGVVGIRPVTDHSGLCYILYIETAIVDLWR